MNLRMAQPRLKHVILLNKTEFVFRLTIMCNELLNNTTGCHMTKLTFTFVLFCSLWCNNTNPHYFINTCMNELQGLLPCDIHSGSHMLTFQRNLLPLSTGWWRKQILWHVSVQLTQCMTFQPRRQLSQSPPYQTSYLTWMKYI